MKVRGRVHCPRKGLSSGQCLRLAMTGCHEPMDCMALETLKTRPGTKVGTVGFSLQQLQAQRLGTSRGLTYLTFDP